MKKGKKNNSDSWKIIETHLILKISLVVLKLVMGFCT